MKLWKILILVCFAAGALATQHGQLSATNPAVTIAGTVAAQNSLIHIMSPVPSQQLSTNFVDVNYELVNPGSSGGDANFLLQLDGRDPVTTKDTTYTFTGLNPGQHSLVVQLVDANGTPVAGGRSTVVFFVLSGGQTVGRLGTTGADVSAIVPASNALPLLSVIGFGVLVGGVASALRTRG